MNLRSAEECRRTSKESNISYINTRLVDNNDCCWIKRFFAKQISFHKSSGDLGVARSFTEIFCVAPEAQGQTHTWPVTGPKLCLLTRWMLKNTPSYPRSLHYVFRRRDWGVKNHGRCPGRLDLWCNRRRRRSQDALTTDAQHMPGNKWAHFQCPVLFLCLSVRSRNWRKKSVWNVSIRDS